MIGTGSIRLQWLEVEVDSAIRIEEKCYDTFISRYI